MKLPENQSKVLELFKQGSGIIEKALAGLKKSELDYAPTNGGWTIRQLIHHITDGDDLWKTAIKIALGNEQAEFSLQWYSKFPQSAWVDYWSYENRSIEISMALFKANRDHIIQLLENVQDGWSKIIKFRKPDGGIELVPVGAIVQIQSDHVVHHVKRINEIRQEISGA